MITIPTAEFTGLITDVLAFAPVVKSDPFRGLLIEWDAESETLYASAYDVLSGARTSWTPGEGQEGGDEEWPQADTITYGGSDPSWRAFVSYDDAVTLAKVFKLPAKAWWVPVNVKVSPTGHRLSVERSRDFGKPEALVSVPADQDTAAKFPSVADIHHRVLYSGTAQMQISIKHPAHRLASFGAARYHGELDMTFGAADQPTAMSMGTRLIGFVYRSGTRPGDVRPTAGAEALRQSTAVPGDFDPQAGVVQ